MRLVSSRLQETERSAWKSSRAWTCLCQTVGSGLENERPCRVQSENWQNLSSRSSLQFRGSRLWVGGSSRVETAVAGKCLRFPIPFIWFLLASLLGFKPSCPQYLLILLTYPVEFTSLPCLPFPTTPLDHLLNKVPAHKFYLGICLCGQLNQDSHIFLNRINLISIQFRIHLLNAY